MSRHKNPRGRAPRTEPLEVGCTIRDRRSEQNGVILDLACQYAHPKADPVYSYLVRWEDGQVYAITENALGAGSGITPVE